MTEISVYRGPSLYGLRPLIRIRLDLGVLEAFPTDNLPGFAAALERALPGLARHGCSYGEPGGFLRRMAEGTWLGHVAEHVALELQALAGAAVTRGKTRSVAGRPGVYDVLYAYADETLGLRAGRLALELVASLLPAGLGRFEGLERIDGTARGGGGDGFDLDAALAELRALARRKMLGPSTAALVAEASRRGIPWFRLDDSSLVQLGYGRHQQRLRAACTTRTSLVAADIAADKELTKHLLREAGLPVPQGVVAETPAAALEAAEALGYPLVVKPLDGNHGRGVTLGVGAAEELLWAFGRAAREGSAVLVEEQLAGTDVRFLVVAGEVVAVAERRPATIVGDGRSSIAALVAAANADPRRGTDHEAPLTAISTDEAMLHFLAASGRSLETVPARGEVVAVTPTANLSQGGTAIDRTDIAHPDNLEAARQAAAVVGLDIAGVDFVLPDIARSLHEHGGGIVEVNAGPGLRMHLHPSEGRGINVARPILDMLFPPGHPVRVPVLAVTGTNGKSTTIRMLAHILAACDRCVGFTTTSGVYVGARRLLKADAAGPRSARMVLAHPDVDVAVLETARGGILREGLGFAECDVGCVLNVQPDHLGTGGIETLEQLAEVKSVVVQAVRREGWSVLNADDPAVAAMRDVAGGRICYFSALPQSQWPGFLLRHIESGGRAVTLDGTQLLVHDGDARVLLDVRDIPATLGGLARCNVANALAAVAMAEVQGVDRRIVAAALCTFSNSFAHSPGRLNIVERDGIRIIVDYAHNAAGLRAVGEVIAGMRADFRRVVGLIGIAGDRRNEDIFEMGRVAGGLFHDIFLKEDEDLRGRRPGEVAALLEAGAFAGGCPKLRIRTVLSERQAVEMCLELSQPGDLLLLTAEDVEAVWELANTYRKGANVPPPQPAAAPPAMRMN